MLPVSTTATWSRMAVIHARCDRNFWAPFFHLHHVRRVHHTATPVIRLRVACLLLFDKMPDEGDAFAPGDTRVGRQRFAVRDGFGAVRHRREEIHDLAVRGDARDQRRLPLGGDSFHHPLAFSCVPHTVPGRHPGPHVLVQPADVVLRAETPPLSRQFFTRDTWHRTSSCSSPSSQPGTCLAATVSTTPAPGRGATPSGWRATSSAGSPQAAHMVALVRPPSPPPSACLSVFCRKVATLKSHSSPRTIVNRAPAAGCDATKSFKSSCVRKHPWVPGGRLAKRCALTNLALQLTMRDRLIIDGNVISVTPWKLRVSFISKLFQPDKCDHLSQDGVRETGGQWVPAHHLLVKVFAEPFVGAGGPPCL